MQNSAKIQQAHLGGASAVKPKGTVGPIAWGFMAAALAVSLIPAVGPGIGHLIDRTRHGMEAKAEKEQLAKWYAPQIAKPLGIRPDQVNVKHLELAARYNPTFAGLVDKVNKEEKRSNDASFTGAVVATPFSFIPGAGTATKVGEIALSMGASTLASLAGKDELLVDDVASLINQKRVQGQPVSELDIAMLSIAHDKALQDRLKKTYGRPFHKMTPKDQQDWVMSSPQFYSAAKKKAYALNANLISEQDLVVNTGDDMHASTDFSKQMERVKRTGSHTGDVQAREALGQFATPGIA